MVETGVTPAALREQAKVLEGARRFGEAVDILWRALALRPDDAETLNELGNNLLNARRPDQAVAILRQALRMSPAEARILSNLGLALSNLGKFEDAEVAFLEALHFNPVLASAHNNLGLLYLMMGRHQAAIVCFSYALLLDANSPGAKRNRALANLALGNFAEGWRDYDHIAFGVEQPASPSPTWNGEELKGKRLLLTAYQGLGDTLQFVRYAPMLRAQCARLVLEVPGPLLDILRDFGGVDEIVRQGDAVPATDVSIPIAALPRVLNTNFDTIPAPSPYLAATPERVDVWRARLGKRLDPKRRLIAIAWQGNPNHQWDHFRSVPLGLFEPLARNPGVQLLSLQCGPGTEQIGSFQHITKGALIVPEEHPHNLADTAALIALADLVITIDSATAHVAGAMVKPTWVALSVAADWRWFTGREDSPWYPTLRLFRQKRINEWDEVFARITSRLALDGERSSAHGSALAQ